MMIKTAPHGHGSMADEYEYMQNARRVLVDANPKVLDVTPRCAITTAILLSPLWLLVLLFSLPIYAFLLCVGAVRLPTATEGTTSAERAEPLIDETDFPGQRFEGFPNALDCGLYWFSAANGGARADTDEGARNFDCTRPSLIYVHGAAPTTVGRGFRETFNWAASRGQREILPNAFDVNTSEAWIAAGYNVGVFYWSQLSDEVDVRHAEAKIHTCDGAHGMRWMRKDAKSGLCEYVAQSHVCGQATVADLLAHELKKAFQSTAKDCGHYRLVGHSLGAQLAVAAAHRLLEDVRCGNGIASGLPMPSRIALVDPFASRGQRHYFDKPQSCGEVLLSRVQSLQRHGAVAVEYVKTSFLADVPVCSLPGLRECTAFVQLQPPCIPWYDVRCGHVAGPALYMLSFALRDLLMECTTPSVDKQARQRRRLDALAAASDDRIHELSLSNWGFRQIAQGDFVPVPKQKCCCRSSITNFPSYDVPVPVPYCPPSTVTVHEAPLPPKANDSTEDSRSTSASLAPNPLVVVLDEEATCPATVQI